MDCKFTNIKRCTKKLLVRELAEWLTLDFFTLFFSFFFWGGGQEEKKMKQSCSETCENVPRVRYYFLWAWRTEQK